MSDTPTRRVAYELSETCDYCERPYGGQIIQAQGPCARCMSDHAAEIETPPENEEQ